MPFSTYDMWYNRGRDFTRRLLFPSPTIRPLRPPKDLPEVKLQSPIFIVGTARSGTTVLSHLLQMHPEIIRTRGIPDGEDTAMWVKYAGAKLAGIGSGRAKQAIGFSFCAAMDENDVDEERRKWLRYHLWKKYQRDNPDKHILNKNPHISNKLAFVHKIFPEARIIHLIRNPVATVASIFKMFSSHSGIIFELSREEYPCWNIYPKAEVSPNREIENERIFRKERIELLIEHWYKINYGISQQMSRNPELRLMTVHYEELVNEPLDTLNKIYQFCELSEGRYSSPGLDKTRNNKWKTAPELNVSLIREYLNARPRIFSY